MGLKRLIKSITSGPAETGLGHFLSQDPNERSARRKQKDPLFGISGNRGIGPYSKQSERVQSHSLSNAIVGRIKKAAYKNKEEASIANAAAAAATIAEAEAAAEKPFDLAKESQRKGLLRKGRRASILTSSQGASEPLGIPG